MCIKFAEKSRVTRCAVGQNQAWLVSKGKRVVGRYAFRQFVDLFSHVIRSVYQRSHLVVQSSQYSNSTPNETNEEEEEKTQNIRFEFHTLLTFLIVLVYQ